MKTRPFGAAVLAALSIAHVQPALAAAGPQASKLDGFWNVDADQRGKSQGAVKAQLTPAAQAIQQRNQREQAARTARGNVVGLASYTCGQLAIPFFINTSEPGLLVVAKDEVVHVTERRQVGPRHFYTDGRSWPDLSKLPVSSVGYSIAHWEGDDLLIETRKMPPGGVAGGGLRGPNAVLYERLSVSADGKRLSWNLRFEDAEMLAAPVSYTIEYDRAEPGTYAYTHDCDPNLGAGDTVVEPVQEPAR